jgi:excisionase family DNA binding protein
VIERLSGVVIDDTEIANDASALALLLRMMADRRDETGAPAPMPIAPRLESLAARLAAAARNASGDASADQAESLEPPVALASPRAQTSTGVQHSGHAPIAATAAATRLGITANGVRDLARRGRIRAHRNGSRWEFDPADVDEFAAQRSPG